MSPRVVILVPRRADGGHRDTLWAFCRNWWMEHHDPMPIYEGHHEGGPFNRSAAINAAAAQAGDWDVALVIDADTISERDPVRRAIAHAAATGALAVAHDQRYMLSRRGTQEILRGDRRDWKRRGMVDRVYRDSVSCAVAVSRATWDLVGGFDERFVGWGYEDTAFRIAVETMTGQPLHVEKGICFHLWHEISPEASRQSPTLAANKSLKLRYEAVRWQPDKMRRVLGMEPPPSSDGIPRILHRTVPANTTPQVEAYWQRFGELHPDWDLRTYREPIDPADWPMTGYLFERCQNGAQKAGLIRLEALYTHGGVYVDSDVEPYRSLEPLLSLKAFAAWEDERVVPDAVLGCTRGHPAFLELIGRARIAVEEGQDAWHSGPGGTTEILPGRDDVLLLPPGAFYPAHYLEKAKLGTNGAKPWVFLEHKWHHSWGTDAQRAQIARAQRGGSNVTSQRRAANGPVVQENVIVQATSDVKVAVCIPWNGTSDTWRAAAYQWCSRYWRDAGLTVFESDADSTSRSAMRNAAARQAIEWGAEVLFFADADTWVPVEQLNAAVTLAASTGRMTHAFTTYCRLGSATTKQYQKTRNVRAEMLARTVQKQFGHISGATAVPIALWREIGGYDERFTGWGLEDRAFDLAARCLAGDIDRVPGHAIHWYHQPDKDKGVKRPADDPRNELVLRYCQAAGHIPESGRVARLAQAARLTVGAPDRDAMISILSESGGPRAAAGQPAPAGPRDGNLVAL